MKNEITDEYILLHLCYQLSNEIPPALRAVGFRFENMTLRIDYFFHGEPSEEDTEDLDCVTTCVVGYLPDAYCESRFIRKDFPEPLPKDVKYAFSRDTHLSQQFDPSRIVDWNANSKIGLHVCQALLGNISPKLRCVGIDSETHFLTKVRFILDENPSEKDLDLINAAMKELLHKLPNVEPKKEVIPFPESLPIMNTIFKRKEPTLLRKDWKETALYALWLRVIDEVPPDLRAVAARMENVKALDAPGSVTSVYFFFEGEISQNDESMLRQKIGHIRDSFPTETVKTHFIRKEIYEPLPDVGDYVFARDTMKLFSTTERVLQETGIISDDAWTISQCLIGKIPSHLRAAGVRTWSPASMDIFFFLDPNATSQERELLKQAANEMISRFPMRRIHVQIEEYPYPNELPKTINYAYKRREP